MRVVIAIGEMMILRILAALSASHITKSASVTASFVLYLMAKRGERMSELQEQKIMDVMHTLSVIRDGKATNAQASAKACWEVLDEVLKLEAKSE